MNNIKHVFFDLDNTLWDFRKNSEVTLKEMYKTKKVHEEYNVEFGDFHEKYYHKNEELWANFRDNLITKEQLRERRFKEAFESVGINSISLAEEFEKNYLDEVTHHHHLVEGAEDVLIYLENKGYSIHVLSNGFEEVTLRKVNKSNLKPYIKTITSAEEIQSKKPDSRIFYYTLEKANAKKEESILIGDDWIADILGAKNINLDAIFYNALQENFDFGDVVVIDKLRELKTIL